MTTPKPKGKTKAAAGPVNQGRLKSFVERIEKLEEERQAVGGDVRDIYSEAKGVGYDVGAIRRLIAYRKLDAADRAERETLDDVYRHALGMAVDLVRDEGLSLREAEAATGASKSSIQRALAVPAVSQPPLAAPSIMPSVSVWQDLATDAAVSEILAMTDDEIWEEAIREHGSREAAQAEAERLRAVMLATVDEIMGPMPPHLKRAAQIH